IQKYAVAIALFFIPGVVFWTSGIQKETLVIGALSIAIAITLNIGHKVQKPGIINLGLIIFLCYTSLMIKFYFVAVLFPALFAYILALKISGHSELNLKNSGIYLLSFVLLLYLATFSNPYLTLDGIAHSIYNNYLATLESSAYRNVFIFEGLRPDLASMLRHAPEALIIGLFRPFFTDVQWGLPAIAAIEYFFISILAIGKIAQVFISKIKSAKLILLPAITYIVITAVLVSIASPNWGTLYRYKAGFIPFFLILILHDNPLINVFVQRFYKKMPIKDSVSSPVVK
ncbi:MAG: hypothetical protein ACK4ND_15355, partial [Cytophagaceae bacterium]